MGEDDKGLNHEVPMLQKAIHTFLEERLQAKLKDVKNDDEGKFQELCDKYLPENWIADAAKRVTQIQQVTHAIKFTNPYAKGSSLNAHGNPIFKSDIVGTHSIDRLLKYDTVGNAATLDVCKFLSIEANGKSILAYANENSPVLLEAFSEYTDDPKVWVEAFVAIVKNSEQPTSSTLAKQLYWPLGKNYHLLSPLFPTSLVHIVWEKVRENRFSNNAKEARKAKRENRPHPHGYHDYPSMAVQKFGGIKPQNISQLNIERHGENYLFASCPPIWKYIPLKPPLRSETVFGALFGRRKRVRELVNATCKFLQGAKSYTNVTIRDKRGELIDHIVDELLQFAAEVQELDGGWSLSSECRLNMAEKLWLDAKRAETDEPFSSSRTRGDWQDDVCNRFAKWLNGRLKKSLPVGDAEHKEWHSALKKQLKEVN